MPEPAGPSLNRGYCIYSDILGFSNRVLGSYSENNQELEFRKFLEAFSNAIRGLNPDPQNPGWFVREFSDSVVLVMPLRPLTQLDDGEGELGTAVRLIGMFQLDLALSGYFLRGAWTLDDIYANGSIVYGRGLINAYHLEQTVALYPRIVLSQDILRLFYHHLTNYAHPEDAPQNYHFLRGEGELIFINYLYNLIGERQEGYYVFWDQLRMHREQIVRNIQTPIRDFNINQKYLWLATYHNYFCERVNEMEGYNDNLRIDLPEFCSFRITEVIPD